MDILDQVKDATGLSLTYDQVGEVAKLALLEHVSAIEFLNQPSDIDSWDAAMMVLSDFMTPEELEEYSCRDVPAAWCKTVLQDALERGLYEKT